MEPKRLALVRHAKSSWADPDIADHDRPLNARGRRAAALVGQHLPAAGVHPDLVLCSSATRARQTLELFQLVPTIDVLIEDQLYGAGSHELLARVRRIPAWVSSAVLIGHNPGLEELAFLLVGSGASEDRARMAEKFPTGAVAVVAFNADSWSAIEPGSGELVHFLTPKRLP